MTDALDKINSDQTTKQLYGRLVELLDAVGPYEVQVKQSSLHVSNGTAFLGVPPRSSGLLLNIVTDAPLASSGRIRKTEQVSRSRCHNEVLILGPDDLDDELRGWIGQAYERSAR